MDAPETTWMYLKFNMKPTLEEIRDGMTCKHEYSGGYLQKFVDVYRYGDAVYENVFNLSKDSVARFLQMIIDPESQPLCCILGGEPIEPKLALGA